MVSVTFGCLKVLKKCLGSTLRLFLDYYSPCEDKWIRSFALLYSNLVSWGYALISPKQLTPANYSSFTFSFVLNEINIRYQYTNRCINSRDNHIIAINLWKIKERIYDFEREMLLRVCLCFPLNLRSRLKGLFIITAVWMHEYDYFFLSNLPPLIFSIKVIAYIQDVRKREALGRQKSS